jgi:uncharacterized protein YbjQ (UPF0145 family)
VFGCLVMHLGWTNSGCGWYGAGATGTTWGGVPSVSPVLVTGSHGYAAFEPYVDAFTSGWYGALDRMLAEAVALGADGVVGVRMARSHLDERASEFTALGTAVRWTRRRDDAGGRPWHTELTAEECAAALRAGFVPRGMVLGLAIATKHADWQLRQQRSSWTGNTEVDGLTQLVRAAREDSRAKAARRGAALGGGTLVVSGMRLTEFETACGKDEEDLHAECVLVGTVLQEGSTSRRAAGLDLLPVLPLTDATDRRSPRRL